jgi:hypothetical protein
MWMAVRSGIELREFMSWDDYDRRQKGSLLYLRTQKVAQLQGLGGDYYH